MREDDPDKRLAEKAQRLKLAIQEQREKVRREAELLEELRKKNQPPSGSPPASPLPH